jgi:acetylornithine deacetylase/succinyl-diaminopimelate desuccinylase-like protein
LALVASRVRGRYNQAKIVKGPAMRLDVVDTLRQLVRIPSVNPMGRPTDPAAGDIYFEHRVTDHLEQLFRSLGWSSWRQVDIDQRENIVVRLDGDVPPEQGGRVLLLEAHQDTVPIEGMTIPPFEPHVANGRLYGRGSCDIKGGMASILAAASRIAEEKPAGRPTLLLGFMANEEHGFSGARTLASLWSGESRSPLARELPRPHSVVVSEPTLLDVVVAHKGVVRWKCHVHGKAAHSSQPQLGESAIYAMAKVVNALERYGQEVVGSLAEHPLVGRPTLSVGTIAGGISVNTVPDHCVIEIDRRVVPTAGDQASAAQQHVIDYLAQHLPAGIRLEHEAPNIFSPGLSDQANAQLAEQLGAAAKATVSEGTAAGKRIGVPYGTDAPAYDSIGIPTVVFGPGSIAQAHTADEWVETDQLHAASEVLYRFAKSFS